MRRAAATCAGKTQSSFAQQDSPSDPAGGFDCHLGTNSVACVQRKRPFGGRGWRARERQRKDHEEELLHKATPDDDTLCSIRHMLLSSRLLHR